LELYLHSPNTPSWRGAQLKHRDNFTFTFYCAKELTEVYRPSERNYHYFDDSFLIKTLALSKLPENISTI
jgi:hypothetical protein